MTEPGRQAIDYVGKIASLLNVPNPADVRGGVYRLERVGEAVLAEIERLRREVVHEVDVRPMTDAEKRAERLTDQRAEQWLARCTCGAEMLPLYPGEANAWEQGHLSTRPVARDHHRRRDAERGEDGVVRPSPHDLRHAAQEGPPR